MNKQYIWIDKMAVKAANALGSQYVVNACPVMAITMFAHALSRELGVQVSGVGILHHECEWSGIMDYNYKPNQRRGAVFIDKADYAGGSKSLSGQPSAEVHLLLSLCLVFESDDDGLAARLDQLLLGKRLAGGRIEGWDAVVSYTDHRRAFSHGQATGGFWVIDRKDLMNVTPNPLMSMVDIMAQRDGPTWLTPTNLGWALLTTPEQKDWVRMADDVVPDHALCEPMIGLTQYVSGHEYDEDVIPCWHWRWSSDDTFVVEQNTP